MYNNACQIYFMLYQIYLCEYKMINIHKKVTYVTHGLSGV